MNDAILIGKDEFESPINEEGSWGQRNLAKRTKSVMELYAYSDDTGFIEWDIPDLDMTEYIGLTYEVDANGKKFLADYDGVMSLPKQAMDLLEKHNIDCSEMRKDLD